ncbi:histidine biosynthesis trifunctional-protein [Phellopilus nigrolimitatus]|nr:histidine biosynthesis trifunctional-protein [Phellopilus nigrolimitatus]
MSSFLALVDSGTSAIPPWSIIAPIGLTALNASHHSSVIPPLSRIATFILPALNASPQSLPAHASYFILADHDSSVNLDDVVSWLDDGADKVVVPLAWANELVGLLPAERLVLLLDVANVSAVPDKLRAGVSAVLVKTPAVDPDLVSTISRFFTGSAIYVQSTSSTPPSPSIIRQVKDSGATLLISTSQLTTEQSSSSLLNIADAFLAPVSSDRPDGLFPTVVSSFLQGGKSLGLVYSSAESIKESIMSGKGVYQSRKHGLWRKGETSGATQDVVKIVLDCDSDSFEFSVIQHGTGFCHLERASCFGHLSGLPALEQTLQSRLESAPEGSYTRRLFNDPDLLHSKIMEEADELCRAENEEQVAFEAADLIYFALTRCVAAGVGIADIERSLDKKAKKVTRRSGNAKPQWSSKPLTKDTAQSSQPVPALPVSDGPIRMRTASLIGISSSSRAELLKRPVLRSDEMIAKVRPIVDSVRTRGDAALLELTAKFDKAQLQSPILLPPYSAQSMELPGNVRAAIDIAYANIYKFHAAQTDGAPLVVETTPGVVCTRFARPIARVGLYVPGGTAVLPSTALMLGIPAQVAGCKEVVLATPPRPDGSISPEVMYVAKLVGASAILMAGGAQAVAALAYGTESVPKVDKIFGPGNQWVMAAKMLVQNDTDALVSIDMPAGPSEVLVIADHTANAAFVAADLLSQAEHGVDSQVVLVAVNLTAAHLAEIEAEVDKQAHALPRVDIMRESVSKSLIVQVGSADEALAFSNDYAPEHLILHIERAPDAVAKVQNAGSVFVGAYTPESCGDYASGTNHTLPTNGYARQFSGVNTQSFQKHITSQEITREGLEKLGPVVATLADREGLGAHANAVRIRLRA